MIMVVTVSMMMLLTGCGSDKSTANHETYVFYSVHDHQTQISLDGLKESLLEQCKTPENKIYLIAVDGKPYQVNDYKIPKKGFLLLPSQKEAAATDYRDQIVKEFKKAVALTDEVAYTKAFEDLGNNIKPNTSYDVIVKGTGLDTTGALDFTKNLLMYDPEDVVTILKDNDMIPDLHGVKSISWYGFGNVDGKKQESLSNRQYNQLESIWREYLIAAGVKEEDIHFYKGKEAKNCAQENLPKVTPVDIPDIDPYQDGRIEEEGTIVNDKLFGGFAPDTADFIDPTKASEFAKSLAKDMKTGKWIVCGFTASDIDSEKTKELSKERANSVCSLLKQNGVNPSQLVALGGGTGVGTDYHTKGLGVGEEAQVNRISVICSVESDEGKQLIQKYH